MKELTIEEIEQARKELIVIGDLMKEWCDKYGIDYMTAFCHCGHVSLSLDVKDRYYEDLYVVNSKHFFC